MSYFSLFPRWPFLCLVNFYPLGNFAFVCAHCAISILIIKECFRQQGLPKAYWTLYDVTVIETNLSTGGHSCSRTQIHKFTSYLISHIKRNSCSRKLKTQVRGIIQNITMRQNQNQNKPARSAKGSLFAAV